ncbi:MAG: hypothetical protein DWQ07_08805 [Chloroflexi bacterium]|nr:MAG: hypothetical protein DWQ07_08805 [Chloroflexota bacterium]MBL1193189.1 hypothetical protein [Chloroflexota bacterium]NOH10483.1 hypothetical protein [Chloroflexota bacterium]
MSPTEHQTPIDTNHTRIALRLVLVFSAVAFALALLALLSEPSEAASAWLLGFSIQRWLLLVAAGLPFLLFGFLAWRAWRNDQRADHWNTRLAELFGEGKRAGFMVAGISVVVLLLWGLALIPEVQALGLFSAYTYYILNIKPLLFAFASLAGFLLVYGLVLLRGIDREVLKANRPLFVLSGALFLVLLLLWLFINVTGLGLGFDITNWNAPGAPVLMWQVGLVLLISVGLLWLLARFLSPAYGWKRLDLYIFLAIWLLATVIWLAQPQSANYYAQTPRPPNDGYYPLSDAFNHDVIAQNALIGEGFRFGGLRAIRKPLYTFFLAGLHALTGPNFEGAITIQVIVLALLPAVFYLLGTRVHHRLSGLLLALLVTWREVNTLALANRLNISHSKLLLVDLPAALALAGFALLAFTWLRKAKHTRLIALTVGGSLGLLMLVRSQNLTLVPIFFLLGALSLWGSSWRRMLEQAALFVLGLSLALGPWVTRNVVLTGQPIVEHSIVTSFVAQRYSFDLAPIPRTFLPGETEGEYYARHVAIVRDFALENPVYVFGFVSDNYVRNLLDTLMILPASFQLYSLDNYVQSLPYWPQWGGELATESLLPLLGSLALLAIGIGVAWHKYKWAGLVPLFINLGFTVNLAIARVSGWRYNLPVDWTTLFYYVFGLSQLILWAWALFGGKVFVEKQASNEKDTSENGWHWPRFFLSAGGILLLGSAMLLTEWLVPRQFTDETRSTSLEQLVLTDAQLADRVSSRELLAIEGRALYPSYLPERVGNEIAELPRLFPRDFDRLTFLLIGPDMWDVVLPLEDAKVEFPQGSDILLLACPQGDYLEAKAVMFLNGGEVIQSSMISETCK